MMESTNTITDQQTPPVLPMNNSSSRRKQSKPNRLEHVTLENPSTCETINSSSILPPLTQYHVAAEQQETGLADDDSDRISLNCEDGSLSPQSTGEHYAMEDIINRSRQQYRTNDKRNFEQTLIEENEHMNDEQTPIGVLDFSLKLDETNKSINRSRSINTIGKSRALKRKHLNGITDNNNGTTSIPTRIFHADAFCAICRKEFCNKYFLKTHLANKHGIFDSSNISSVSNSNLSANLDSINDSNLQHPFTVISTLLQNGHEDLSSSPTSPSSDLIQNHRTTTDDENETELSSLRHEMNGIIAGDEDNHHQHHEQIDVDNNNNNNNNDDDDDDDDEQDGTNSNSLINLPQKIATILSNDNNNNNKNSLSMFNDNDDEQQEIGNNSPTNSLDYQQQTAGSSSQTSILPLTSSSTNTTTTNLSRQSSTKLAEDFCDICQKHFCNKYYLRKHKLDVHGVQTDCNIKPYKRIENSLSTKNSPTTTTTITTTTTSSSSSSSSSQITPAIQLPASFSNVTFNPTTVQQSLGMLLNPLFSPLVQSQTNSEITTSSNKRRYTDNSNDSSSSSLSKPQFPPSLLTAASDVANAFVNQLNSSNTTTNSSKSQISTCHLCGKKFQNNDYLQLHLMNKHQITNDISNQDSQQRTKLSNSIKLSNGTINSNTVKKIKLETNETPSSSTVLINASSPIDTITSPNPSAVIPGIVDTYFAAKMADRVSCDICHKQVCNKYFLKTHKLKVHGVTHDISVSSQVKSETNEDNIEQQHDSRSSFDGSPPQLVVDELNSNNTEPGVIPSPDSLTASVNTFIGTNNNNNNNSTNNDSIEQSPSTTNCKICSKSFPTKFLHVHMNNVHGIQQAPILITNGTTNNNNNKTQLVTNTIKRSISNGNNMNVRLKQTPQVQLRVTCQVCKKELCNKYFLRAHMRNVHNISVDDLRFVQPQSITSQLSPSSDQSSTKGTFSLSSNLLSATSTIPTTDISTLKHSSSSNDNDLNGHTTDSNDSEGLQHLLPTSIITKTTQIGTNDNNNNNNLLSMQPFLIESDDDVYKDLFVPCMVYLPCRHRVTKTLEVSLRLKPVDPNTSTTTTTNTTTTTAEDD